MSVSGLNFDGAWKNRVYSNFEEVETFVISRDDLIRIKEASARPQDLIDVRSLKKAAERDKK